MEEIIKYALESRMFPTHNFVFNENIIAVGDTEFIFIIDIATKKTIYRVSGNYWGTESLDISPNGNYFARGDRDGFIKIWLVSTGTRIKTIGGYGRPIYDVKFSPDGNYIASCGEDKTISLWSLSTGEEILKIIRHKSQVANIDFSPDGNYIVSYSADKTIRIWRVSDGEEIRKIDTYMFKVGFSPDGKYIASVDFSGNLKIWSLKTGKEIYSWKLDFCIRNFIYHQDKIFCWDSQKYTIISLESFYLNLELDDVINTQNIIQELQDLDNDRCLVEIVLRCFLKEDIKKYMFEKL